MSSLFSKTNIPVASSANKAPSPPPAKTDVLKEATELPEGSVGPFIGMFRHSKGYTVYELYTNGNHVVQRKLCSPEPVTKGAAFDIVRRRTVEAFWLNREFTNEELKGRESGKVNDSPGTSTTPNPASK